MICKNLIRYSFIIVLTTIALSQENTKKPKSSPQPPTKETAAKKLAHIPKGSHLLTAAGELAKQYPGIPPSSPIKWVTEFSKSGATRTYTGPDGLIQGALRSKYYLPYDSNFEVVNGQITKIPYPGKTMTKPQAEFLYDSFGNILVETIEGYELKYSNYDQNGRPGKVIYPNGTSTIITYSFEPGLRVVTEEHPKRSIITKYNADDWLMEESITIKKNTGSNTAVITTYQYDALGRLQKFVVDGTEIYSAGYWNDTQVVQTETVEGVRYDYTVRQDGTINGLKVTTEGKLTDIRYETDKLGRVIGTEMPGVGPVKITYDGADRPVEVKSESGTQPVITTFAYVSPGITVTKDHIWNRTTWVFNYDAAGLHTRVMEYGPGIKQSVRINTTKISENDGKGYIFDVIQNGGLFEKRHRYNALGFSMGGSVDTFRMMADSTSEHGTPTNFTGAWSSSVDIDENFQTKSVTDPSGMEITMEYDSKGRVTKGQTVRGQYYDIGYYAEMTVKANDVKIGEEGEEIKLSDSKLWLVNSAGNIIGANRIVSADNPGKVLKILKTDDNGIEQTQTLNYNDSGLLSTMTDFAGLEYTFPRDGYGRLNGTGTIAGKEYTFAWNHAENQLTITEAGGGNPLILWHDAYGRVYRSEKGRDHFEIIRDVEYRPTQIITQDGITNFKYTGALLTEIQRNTSVITFSEHDAQGNPGKMDISDSGQISYEFHPGGKAAKVSASRNGGLTTAFTYNNLGDLTSVKDGMLSEITYTPNDWGYPASMTYKAATTALYGPRNNLNWSLPEGVGLRLNIEGLIKETSRPGQGVKTYNYDGNHRVTDISLNGSLLNSFVYNGLDLQQIIAPEGTTTLENDDKGRLEEVTGPYLNIGVGKATSERSYGSFTYEGDSDYIQTYTDPNGAKATYWYGSYNKVRKILLENGPVLSFEYDLEGNLISTAASDGIIVQFQDYEKGLPKTVKWGHNAEHGTFAVEHTDDGLLSSVSNEEFLLSIDWETISGRNFSRIQKVERRGPGLGEEITPTYVRDYELESVIIIRSTGEEIHESYGISEEHIPTKLERRYKESPTGTLQELLNLSKQLGENGSIASWSATGSQPYNQNISYDGVGNLQSISSQSGSAEELELDYTSHRWVHEIRKTRTDGSQVVENNSFDYAGRRSDSSGPAIDRLVYFYQGNRVIAIGLKKYNQIRWTHLIGYGPYGPCFLQDVTGYKKDYYIFTDQVGTPFAFKNIHTGEVTYTPFNPWGELLATPNESSSAFEDGLVPTQGFNLPEDALFGIPPIGLFGHLYNPKTGIVYMRNRFYHPRLGHFTTPDFQKIDIFNPRTFTDAYAIAAGSPLMFYDPDGLNYEYIADGKLIRVEFTKDGVKDEVFVDHIVWERLIKGKLRIGSAWFGPLPKDVTARQLSKVIYEREDIIADLLIDRLYPRQDYEVSHNIYSTLERDCMIAILVPLSMPIAVESALAMGLMGTLSVTGASAAFDIGHQTLVEHRSLNEINLLQTATSSYLGLLTGGTLKMGFGSANPYISGTTKTIAGFGGGAGTIYGGMTAYEGYSEGDVGKTLFGATTGILSAWGTYSVMKSLFVPQGKGLVPKGHQEKARLAEYRRFRNQGLTPKQARYLLSDYRDRMGHHFLPRRIGYQKLKLSKWLMESRFNVMKPKGISLGRFYERHFYADKKFFGTGFPRNVGGSWSGRNLGLSKPGPVGRLWYAMPTPTKFTLGLGSGSAFTYFFMKD